jgi:mannobiose 2-epimerase
MDFTNLPTLLKERMERELRGNILPFWINHSVDRQNGGFYGALSNDLVIDDTVERSLVLCARLLWTYSAAYRFYREPAYLEMAHHAYAYLTGPFHDLQYGGMYWQLDPAGRPLSDRKQTYGQAFAIYALAEFHRATGEPEPLGMAQVLFELVEQHAADPQHGGYIEGCARDWGTLADMRLSEKELYNSPKSMNTLLHILEAYSGLLRVWEDPRLYGQQKKLVETFLERVIDPRTHFTRLFFDLQWNPIGDLVSFGHDIECSWLLVEAARGLADEHLSGQVQQAALEMAEAVHARGLDMDGSIFYEGSPTDISNPEKHWWAHAEGVVGFYNAYEICPPVETVRREKYLSAALRLWDFIEAEFVDKQHGEWFKVLDRLGTPNMGYRKAGPWEDPYHQARACMEIICRV